MAGGTVRMPGGGVDAVIAGLGITEVGKVYRRTPRSLAAEAVRLAAADAALPLGELDGLLVSGGMSGGVDIGLAAALGLRDLTLLSEVNAFGATAGAMVAQAAMAVSTGAATAVACVFADAPLREGARAGDAYRSGGREWHGLGGYQAAMGFRSVNDLYALAARRHMAAYGTTSEQLGAVAVAQRDWAAGNPRATYRRPITVADHQASRWIAEPLHLLDCCLVSNGGIAVIVTGSRRAVDLARPPVHVWGFGQGHPGTRMRAGSDFGLRTGAAASGAAAMAMAGIGPAEVDLCELYDCYTYTVLVTLEDYRLCGRGEGGAFAASGALAPGGALPTNTGGGQLSGFYLWGMTPLSEAVIQARGEGGDRQAGSPEVILVSGNGGILDHHATLVLSPLPRGRRPARDGVRQEATG